MGYWLLGYSILDGSKEDLRRAMDKYMKWIDENLQSVDQNVDQEAQSGEKRL